MDYGGVRNTAYAAESCWSSYNDVIWSSTSVECTGDSEITLTYYNNSNDCSGNQITGTNVFTDGATGFQATYTVKCDSSNDDCGVALTKKYFYDSSDCSR